MRHDKGSKPYDQTFIYIGVGGTDYFEKAYWDKSQVVDIVTKGNEGMHTPSEKERKLITEAKAGRRHYSAPP